MRKFWPPSGKFILTERKIKIGMARFGRMGAKMNKKKAFMLFIDMLLGVLLVWFDQFTKGLAISHLKGRLIP